MFISGVPGALYCIKYSGKLFLKKGCRDWNNIYNLWFFIDLYKSVYIIYKICIHLHFSSNFCLFSHPFVYQNNVLSKTIIIHKQVIKFLKKLKF